LNAGFPPVHPGVILREEFLEPMGLTTEQLAVGIGVPDSVTRAIASGAIRIPVDVALRLSRFFGMSDEFWAWLQTHYDIERARDRNGAALDQIQPYAAK